MRRFWLALLMFVLPLQMSWAAVHFCDGASLARMSVEEVGVMPGHDHGNETSQVAEDQKSATSDKSADACCGAAHGCHGLHHLMGSADAALVPVVASQLPVQSGAAPPAGALLSRVERPKWPAA